MFTTPMTQLFAVALSKDRERVTEALLCEGVMQFIKVSELDSSDTEGAAAQESDASLTALPDLRKRVEEILHTINIVPSRPVEADLGRRINVDTEKENQRLDDMEKESEALRERQRTLQQEVVKLEDIKRQVSLYGLDFSGPASSAHSLLGIKTGKLAAARVGQLDDLLRDAQALRITMGVERNEAYLLLLFMKRDREAIERLLSGIGWTEVKLPEQQATAEEDLLEQLANKVQTLADEQHKIQDQIASKVRNQADHLTTMWTHLRVNELCSRMQTYFENLSRTVLFAGWVPSSKQAVIAERIAAATQGRCHLEWHQADSKEVLGLDVPVQLQNPRVLAPFEMLISNFGIPKYGTIDPTPFVMIVYLCMFGLMFGDAGQGLVLAGVGAGGTRLLKRRGKSAQLCNLMWLIFWCGLSSTLFGVLFGSYFGFSLFQPLWFDLHAIVSGHGSEHAAINDIFDILALTVYFGISVIFIGLLFNWINMIRERQWFELVFSKGGILGGWIYAGGIYIAKYVVAHGYKSFPNGAEISLLVGLPAVLMFIRGPWHYFRHEHDSAKTGGTVFAFLNFFMEWGVELLEIFSGYLSNTLSFMRVAGLGIAHVSLMVSFFAMAEMTSGVFSVIVLILGNILVIGLEGLSAGIQALRLNYYEFFSKFFHGTGKLHTPISLNSKL